MDRRTTHRLPLGSLLTLLVAATVAIGPLSALAQTNLDQITIAGPGLAEPLVVRAEERPEQATALHSEVSWLVGRDGDAPEPDPEALGPLYAIVVHIDGQARHRFHLFPLAEGGPRAFRPAGQPPDRTVDEGWFYGRLKMAETLTAAGVPLPGEPAPPGGGTGGGEPAPDATDPPDSGGAAPLAFLDEWWESVLLATALAMVMLAGLGGVAYLIRRAV